MQRTNTVNEAAALILKARCMQGASHTVRQHPANQARARGLLIPASVQTECMLTEEADGTVIYYILYVSRTVVGHILALHPHGEAHPEDVYVSYM